MNGASLSELRPPLMIVPHVAVGGSTLAPSRARPPSVTIATPMPSRAIEISAGRTFGNTSRNSTRQSLAPCAREAITNSRCDHVSVLARAMRATIGIDTMPRAMMRITTGESLNPLSSTGSPFRTATRARARTSWGIASMMSNSPTSRLPTRPLK